MKQFRALIYLSTIAALSLTGNRGALLADEKSASSTGLRIDSALVSLIEQVEVPAREVGQLNKMLVKEGSTVRKGELLAQIEDSESNLLLQQAKLEYEMAQNKAENDINIRFARKSHEVAVAELRRAEDSIKKYSKSISKTELDRLKLTAEKAELEIEQTKEEAKTSGLEARLKQNSEAIAALAVQKRKVIAPISGMVVQIMMKEGEWVRPGETVLRLLKLDRLRAEGLVKLSRLQGQNLKDRPVILLVNPGTKQESEFRGKISFVSPEINPLNNQTRVWAEIENPDLKLKPGMRASLIIK
ncbi:MAG: efflux RND transporter periplasmic adaptor subunit [Planctomycetes bacterium]|nr:efflux RND transporter periplasmic adaptor subunit [Planctomycetota bacterium]MCH9725432.1 efflux RND transporter periplasmic adaptor subunit [Planctomycetota bacterium]MCH9776529.1 efflux RND transporter periplasmic adaptor subunit [Planctomycetota bacterium]MCH9789544.1 efflux RND transporter periplasmic adaptor subunit [Planctomycetota bacterium]MDF1742303.1 efflux RND transporter periplasmic adaptor subunit [Gimesia sp.]